MKYAKYAAAALVLVALTVAPAAAQGRGNKKGKVPPGHMPPAGMCRVWYEGVPPGRQPRPTSCAEAEREAARSDARVIYGDGRATRGSGGGGTYGRDGRDDRDDRDDRAGTDRRRPRGDRRGTSGRAIPRTERYPSSDARYSPAVQNGYRDGLVKGREDAEDGDSFDPDRHSWYRSADRGYSSRYGSREDYRADYRRGFLEGYDAAYVDRSRSENRSGTRPDTRRRPWWWPF